MTSYTVYLKHTAEKELAKLPAAIHDKILNKLISLKDNPRPTGSKKLHTKEGYRIRIGDYRVLYIINDIRKKVEIVSITHRREAYR